MLHQCKNITKLARVSHLFAKYIQALWLTLGAKSLDIVSIFELTISQRGPWLGVMGCWGWGLWNEEAGAWGRLSLSG